MNPYVDYSRLIFTCVSAPPRDVSAAFLDAFNRVDATQQSMYGVQPDQYEVKTLPLDLALAYVDRPPATSYPDAILFWSPASGVVRGLEHTVFMTTTSDGRSLAIWKLAKETPWRWINIDVDDSPAQFYQGFRFQYHDAFRTVNRDIRAGIGDDDRWFFDARGDLMPFENADHYQRSRIKDRLNRRILSEYLQNIGYDITDAGFWGAAGPAYYVVQRRPDAGPISNPVFVAF
jgi:hypothetical protein